MTRLVDELKVRARLRLNARRSAEPTLRLRDCLHEVARAVGFRHWEHARSVLGGEAAAGDDFGAFWHAPRCNELLSLWFADRAEAREALAASADGVLLPYRRQYVVVSAVYVRELGLPPGDAAWAAARRDLATTYGSPAWLELAWRRLQAPPETFSRG